MTWSFQCQMTPPSARDDLWREVERSVEKPNPMWLNKNEENTEGAWTSCEQDLFVWVAIP
jgi:hypothetical protein